MRSILKFIRRYKMNRLARKLNKANMFQQVQRQHMTAEEIEDLRWRQANKHRIAEWRASARVIINFHETSPDSSEGRAFLGALEAADVHYLAGEIHYDGRYDEDWAMAFATHPKCDLGTGWLLFLGSGSPMIIEKTLWENASAENPVRPFDVAVHRNDTIFARMQAGDFATRDFAPQEPGHIWEYKVEMEEVLAAGHVLRWDFPDDAFTALKGMKADSQFEKRGDEVFEAFKIWLAANDPELLN